LIGSRDGLKNGLGEAQRCRQDHRRSVGVAPARRSRGAHQVRVEHVATVRIDQREHAAAPDELEQERVQRRALARIDDLCQLRELAW
jgi:hypothetical protein